MRAKSKYKISRKKIEKCGVNIFKFILLLGLSYIVLYPFLFKILSSFMSNEDLYDATVELIPKNWQLGRYKEILLYTEFLDGMKITAAYSLLVATGATFSAAFVGYGLAKFKFPLAKITLILVVASMMIPIATLSIPLYSSFRFFDIFGISELISGEKINLTGTPFPMALLSFTGLSFRSGIFIILLRQYYVGVPNELLEAAYVDGSGVINTFLKVVLPMAKSMLIVVFSLSFAWEWTDTFYYPILNSANHTLSNVVITLNLETYTSNTQYISSVTQGTGAIMAIMPLLVFYAVLQKQIIQGIERSGIVG